MKTFNISFLFFVFIVQYINNVNSSSMWTSLEQSQTANKSPSKKCVSPCRIFHTWCKNEGKCREKGRDCTWYCECPSDCEGFFCEKKVEKDISIDSGQTVEVKVSYEKEKKKPVSAFDKSKLAQALAGIFLKEKRTDEEKKTVLPETIERVGNEIKTKENITSKVILNCPPGELHKKASAGTEQTTDKTISDVPNNQNQPTFVSQSIKNNSEITKKITTPRNHTSNQPRPEQTENPIVSSSYLDTKTITKTTTEIPRTTQYQSPTFESQPVKSRAQVNESNFTAYVTTTTIGKKNIVKERTTLTTAEHLKGDKPIENTRISNSTISKTSSEANIDLSQPMLTIKQESSPSSAASMSPSEISTVSTVENKAKSESQSVQSNTSSVLQDSAILSTTMSSITDTTVQSETKPIKQNSISEIQTTVANLKQTLTSFPEQQQDVKDSNPPVQNSLYLQKTNVINEADKPNLLQIIEKAIEVQLVTTTEKATAEKATHKNSVESTTVSTSNSIASNSVTLKLRISTMPTTVRNNMNRTAITLLSSSSSLVKPTKLDKNSISKINNETEKSTRHKESIYLTTSTKQLITNKSAKRADKLPIVYDEKTTNLPFTGKVTSTEMNLNIKDSKNASKIKLHDTLSNQVDSSTTPSGEYPNNDEQTSRLPGTRFRTNFVTTTIKTTHKAFTRAKSESPDLKNISKTDKSIPFDSSNDNEQHKQEIAEDSAAGKYKSTRDSLSTNEINLSSSTNVPLLNMSKDITVNHDLPKTNKLDMSAVQTIMSNEITPEQGNSKTSVDNIKESTASHTTKQSTHTFPSESKKPTTEPNISNNIASDKSVKEIKEMNSLKVESSTKSSISTPKNKMVLNESDQTNSDTNVTKNLEILKPTKHEVLPTSTSRFIETSTRKSTTQMATTTATTVLSSEPITESTEPFASLVHQMKNSANASRDINESIGNISIINGKITTQNGTNRTENAVSGTTTSIFNTTEISTESQLESSKPSTESVIYSAGVEESKLSFAKDILENKSDILKESKVKNGMLNNKLSETVKDLKFDLLKMGLRDKGLPSDLDNIL